MWKCKHCDSKFDFVRATDKANHTRHCDNNPKKQDSYTNIKTSLSKRHDITYGPKTEFTVECFKCHDDVTVIEREKSFPSKEKYFCSRSCANSQGGRAKADKHHPDETARYQSVCFRYHAKECVVCDEQNIIAVHHYNENHDDNRPENLVPLCPTHHMYMHSRFKYLIEDDVHEYVQSFTLGNGLGDPDLPCTQIA